LVKMATLPEAAPVDQLIARLEAMERRLGGGEPPPRGGERTVAAPAAPPARSTSAPAPRPAATPAAAPRAVVAPAPDAPVGAGWDGFLAAAQSKIRLKLLLNGSRLLEESADLLHIGVESELAVQALRDPESMALLQDLAARAFGGPRRLQVSVAKP